MSLSSKLKQKKFHIYDQNLFYFWNEKKIKEKKKKEVSIFFFCNLFYVRETRETWFSLYCYKNSRCITRERHFKFSLEMRPMKLEIIWRYQKRIVFILYCHWRSKEKKRFAASLVTKKSKFYVKNKKKALLWAFRIASAGKQIFQWYHSRPPQKKKKKGKENVFAS